MVKKITTIVFDIGGVLLDIHLEKTYQYISDSTDLKIDVVKFSQMNDKAMYFLIF